MLGRWRFLGRCEGFKGVPLGKSVESTEGDFWF